MLLKICWRNIWRSPTRSMVVIAAVSLGVWGLLFLLGFTRGIVRDYINKSIKEQSSYYQVHHHEFKKDYNTKYTLDTTIKVYDKIVNSAFTKAFCKRSIANGMISSARAVRGIKIIGINSNQESEVTGLDTKIVEGGYFDSNKKNQILISDDIAEKLKIKLKKKVVLSFQDSQSEIVSAAFRVVGIFDTKNTLVDMSRIFVQQKDLNRLLGVEPDQFHEIAVVGTDIEKLDEEMLKLSKYDDVLMESYKDISPELELFNSQLTVNLIVMTVIFMLALIFGIINTMLMTVLERTRELGMLMAIGMKRLEVFKMIVIETILLTLTGVPLGLFLGFITTSYYKKYGLDLSNFSEAMQSFGMSEIVRPYLTMGVYGFVIIAVGLTAILAAIYPARKATSLNPAEAIRAL